MRTKGMKAKADSGQKHFRENTPGSLSGMKHKRDWRHASALWRMWYKPVAFWSADVSLHWMLSLWEIQNHSKCLCTDFCPWEDGTMFPLVLKEFPCSPVPSNFINVRNLHAGCHKWVGMREHKRRVDCGMSALQLGKWSQTGSNHNFSKVVPLPALSWACQRCCSCSVDLDTVSASPQEIRGLGFHQAPSLAGRSSSCPSPWGKGKHALLRSTCHLLLSSRRLHKLHREGFIWEDEMDFAIQSSYRTNCVWACVFVPVFSDPLLLSDILFPLSIWQLRLYLPLGRLFSTQETSFTNKQHLGSIWEMLPFS